MSKEREEQMVEDHIPEKKGFITWVKENKSQLLLAGISISALIMTIIGIKNKDAIDSLWQSLKKEIKMGGLYSAKWFESADLEDLEKARRNIELDYLNPNLDFDYRIQCNSLLKRIDNAIGKLKWNGKEYGYPVHGSNGWHLSSND